MFTGIIEAIGHAELDGETLLVSAPPEFVGQGYAIGESISVNGCCLTLVSDESQLRFDLSPETLRRTSLGDLSAGSRVNLERAMRADGRFGGHVVQGHVDAVGHLISRRKDGNSEVFRFTVPEGNERYLIDKGSITVEGISLTIVQPQGSEFEVWVIPHTLEVTNLTDRRLGDRLNLEFDVIAKYVERLLQFRD